MLKLPTMQLNHQQFGRRLGCVKPVADKYSLKVLASSRDGLWRSGKLSHFKPPDFFQFQCLNVSQQVPNLLTKTGFTQETVRTQSENESPKKVSGCVSRNLNLDLAFKLLVCQ